MGNFQRKPEYDISYGRCVYAGISREIDFESKYGRSDRREVLAYLVNRYCEEHIVSGKYLRDELEEYNTKAAEKYGNIEGKIGRDATKEERESVEKYVNSISTPTGENFFDHIEKYGGKNE